jgi:AraC-like DNA-binding protein
MDESPVSLGLVRQRIIGPNDWRWRLHDDLWRIWHNREAGARVVCGTLALDLPARVAVVIPPWLTLQCSTRRRIPHVAVHGTATLPSAWVTTWCTRPLVMEAGSAVAALVDPVHDGTTDPLLRRCDLLAALAQAVAWYVRQLPSEAVADLRRRSERPLAITDARRILDERFHEPCRIADLARRCHLSPEHFSRRFRALAGDSPQRYLLARRIAAAQHLLIQGDGACGLADLAVRCGFGSSRHLCRSFAQAMGMPPQAWRRQQLAERRTR